MSTATASPPDFRVPPLIVGAWQLSAGHASQPVAEREVLEAFTAFADRGFTAFDCADIYTGVEELLGRFRRHYAEHAGAEAAGSLRVHTKFVPDRDALGKVDRRYVERIVDRSLERLDVDRLDLVQFAWWDYAVPRYVEVAALLDEQRRAGKIRHLGTTNFDVPRLAELADAGIPMVAHQVQYSVVDRRPEHGLTDWCARHGVGLLCYGTLGGGLYADRYLGASEPAEPFENRSLRKYALMVEEFGGWTPFQRLLESLQRIGERYQASVADVALRWVLDRPAVTAAIVGVRHSRHLEALRRALALRLDDGDRAHIAAAQTGRGPDGPVFGLERVPGGPHAAIMRYDLNRPAG